MRTTNQMVSGLWIILVCIAQFNCEFVDPNNELGLRTKSWRTVNLKGKVTDATNGSPIQGVRMQASWALENGNSGGKNAATDAAGDYSMSYRIFAEEFTGGGCSNVLVIADGYRLGRINGVCKSQTRNMKLEPKTTNM